MSNITTFKHLFELLKLLELLLSFGTIKAILISRLNFILSIMEKKQSTCGKETILSIKLLPANLHWQTLWK